MRFKDFTSIVEAHHLGKFVTNIDSQLSDTIDTDLLPVLFMAIDGEEQIGDETSEYLRHEAVSTAGDQMIHIEMLFPPTEEDLYIPAELVNESDILCF